MADINTPATDEVAPSDAPTTDAPETDAQAEQEVEKFLEEIEGDAPAGDGSDASAEDDSPFSDEDDDSDEDSI